MYHHCHSMNEIYNPFLMANGLKTPLTLLFPINFHQFPLKSTFRMTLLLIATSVQEKDPLINNYCKIA